MGNDEITIIPMRTPPARRDGQTFLEKALDVCESLAAAPRGLSVSNLARALHRPAPTVHRLLAVLKRRGFVRQDEETLRYSLTLKMLDLSFRFLGRSELRLHAYPVLREYVLRTGLRAFIAVPGASEVTYLWTGGPDEVGMHTTHGREMPVHCALYVDASAKRRLSCLKLEQPRDALNTERNRGPVRRSRRTPDSASDLHVCAGARLYRAAGGPDRCLHARRRRSTVCR